MTSKKSLRQRIRQQRKALSPHEVQLFSQRICEHIIALTDYQQAQHIACYLPYQNEVDLRYCIEHAWDQGKHIYLPVVDPQTPRAMHFYTYEPHITLITTELGIAEPHTDSTPIQPTQIDLMLIPLIAFDVNGNRLGQGAGYYDHFLTEYPMHKTIGVGYELQKLAAVPVDTWDRPLDLIVTEQACYRCA